MWPLSGVAEQPIHYCLLKATELSASDIALLREDLIVKIDELQKIANSLSVRPTSSTHKKDMVDRNVGMFVIHLKNVMLKM